MFYYKKVSNILKNTTLHKEQVSVNTSYRISIFFKNLKNQKNRINSITRKAQEIIKKKKLLFYLFWKEIYNDVNRNQAEKCTVFVIFYFSYSNIFKTAKPSLIKHSLDYSQKMLH